VLGSVRAPISRSARAASVRQKSWVHDPPMGKSTTTAEPEVIDSERRALTMRGVANALDCSERQVRKLIADGELRTFLIGSKRGVRITVAEVDRFMRARERVARSRTRTR
jgi:excisionase family DNA binding protein